MRTLDSTPAELSMTRLKPFLLHPSSMVRDAVAFYLYESWATDEDLLPLVLEASRRFGPDAVGTPLRFSSRFPFTRASLDEALCELARQDRFWLEHGIARAPLDLVADRWKEIRKVTSGETQDRLARRRDYQKLSVSKLWQELESGSRRLARRCTREAELSLADLVEAIAAKEQQEVVTGRCLQLARVENPYLKPALIELAGARRVRELLPQLVALLGSENDGWENAAREALGRLGDLDCLRLISESLPQRSESFRFSVAHLLRAIKHRDSEASLRAFLASEEDPEVRGAIFDALRFHFTEEAAELMRGEIHRPTSFVLDSELKKALFVNAQILGRNDPDSERWSSELDEAGDGEICLEISFLSMEGELLDEESCPFCEEEAQALDAGIKVGRNQPCPCGSGKKFKKCCRTDGNIWAPPLLH